MKVLLRAREGRSESAVRCALCHDDLSVATERCLTCGTLLHEECRASLDRCPTLGCTELESRIRVALATPLVRRLWTRFRPLLPYAAVLAAVILVAIYLIFRETEPPRYSGIF